jgi:glycosyltransferase involved in cell wall biosynthesis
MRLRSNVRLGMSLIVRDEADIIAENIEFHAKMGVDVFAVIDNGSKDGTREILESLRTCYDLYLFEERGPFEQERQATFLARFLREHRYADWLISNDADEFWLPKNGNLKQLINPSRPVLTVGRYNFLPRKEDVAAEDYKFYQNVLLVDKPYGVQPPVIDPHEQLLFPIMFRNLPGKIACSLAGLEYVHKGNHAVKHAAGGAQHSDQALVFHYQIRSYENFESKIRNHGERLRTSAGDTSWHLRRWYARYLAGALLDEYESLLLDREQAQKLLAAGVVKKEPTIANFFLSAAGLQ